METYQVEHLPKVDQREIKRGLCPWCLVRLVDDGKNDCCPECGDKFTGKIPSVRLKELLDGFLLLPQGWDSYGADRFSERVISKAKAVAQWLPGDGWNVVPCPNGAVQFEKHEDGFDIEIYVEAV